MTRVMLISNQRDLSSHPGYLDGLASFVTNAEISAYDAVSAVDRPPSEAGSEVARRIRAFDPDVVLALSLKQHVPVTAELRAALRDRQLVYWEGDAWGRGKPLPDQTADWLDLSDVVYSVAGAPQAQLLIAHGARVVRMTLHTFDQVLFAGLPTQTPDHAVSFAGNNLQRLPGFGGLPGSTERRLLVRRLRAAYGPESLLAGRGWPRRYGMREVAYPDLGSFFGRSRVVTSWEHYTDHEAYASDRLAVVMASGRVLVTSGANGLDTLLPSGAVHFAGSVDELLATVEQLLGTPGGDLSEAGAHARQWAATRLRTVDALRHMLHDRVPGMQPPDPDPWAKLPGPWTRSR